MPLCPPVAGLTPASAPTSHRQPRLLLFAQVAQDFVRSALFGCKVKYFIARHAKNQTAHSMLLTSLCAHASPRELSLQGCRRRSIRQAGWWINHHYRNPAQNAPRTALNLYILFIYLFFIYVSESTGHEMQSQTWAKRCKPHSGGALPVGLHGLRPPRRWENQQSPLAKFTSGEV